MKLRRANIVILAAALSWLAPTPAIAQSDEPEADQVTDGPPDRESTILVYGEDACPPSTENEVVVCARRPEEERYRIPRSLRRSGQPQEQAWGARVEIARGGLARHAAEQLLGGRHLSARAAASSR